MSQSISELVSLSHLRGSRWWGSCWRCRSAWGRRPARWRCPSRWWSPRWWCSPGWGPGRPSGPLRPPPPSSQSVTILLLIYNRTFQESLPFSFHPPCPRARIHICPSLMLLMNDSSSRYLNILSESENILYKVLTDERLDLNCCCLHLHLWLFSSFYYWDPVTREPKSVNGTLRGWDWSTRHQVMIFMFIFGIPVYFYLIIKCNISSVLNLSEHLDWYDGCHMGL